MKPEEMLVKIDWSKIVKIIVSLVKFSKGGITRDESKLLVNMLLELVADLTDDIFVEKR